jgi:hypothetical protein
VLFAAVKINYNHVLVDAGQSSELNIPSPPPPFRKPVMIMAKRYSRALTTFKLEGEVTSF